MLSPYPLVQSPEVSSAAEDKGVYPILLGTADYLGYYSDQVYVSIVCIHLLRNNTGLLVTRLKLSK